ncbi:hypothetical protein T492DRAFT_863788 [Pavlovales sp. CCMP2436]|nr:hypothetical protein T492DRAFT_863788 [Pavlovales sp. CCMP2436]
MASLLLNPLRLVHDRRLVQPTYAFGPAFGFGAGMTAPMLAPEPPIFSSSLRERVILLANQLVIAGSQPTMSTDPIIWALCHTLRHVRSTPQTSTRGSAPRPTLAVLPREHMMNTPNVFEPTVVLSTLPQTAASIKRHIDVDYEYSDFATPTKKVAHGTFFNQLTDPAVVLPPPVTATQLDLRPELASDWSSILGSDNEFKLPEHQEHGEHDNFWHVLDVQLGMTQAAKG